MNDDDDDHDTTSLACHIGLSRSFKKRL